MPGFERVLQSVLSQKTPWPFDVVVIDSGSNDGTVEFARAQDNVTTISIAPEAFGHGRTRNQAIETARGEFVALLTQDAEPCDERWLTGLVEVLGRDEKVAGVFGRHVAHAHADPFTRRDLEQHFQHFQTRPHVVDRYLDGAHFDESERARRQFLYFYSNNNSCLRRSVWQKIPFPDVAFSEDQAWAKAIIEAGFAKAYAPEAAVYHSHAYGVWQRFQRSFDEAMGFKKLFGVPLRTGLGRTLLAAYRRSRSDLAWASTAQPPISRPARAQRVLQNFALSLGHVAGSNYAKWPQWLRSRLSYDHRFSRKGAGT